MDSMLRWMRRYYLLKLVLFLICFFLLYKSIFWIWDIHRLTQLQSSWKGFGTQEKGFYDFTVVTGLFDIGRGGWWTQGRTYNQYLGYLFQILMLDVNLVVFIEPKGKSFVETIRQGRASRTVVVPTELSDLEYFPFLSRIQEIMASPSFQEDNDNYMRGLPEATDPLYDLVTNSKTTLMHRAITNYSLQSDYFIWMDGGYGHGNASIFPSDGIWHPRHLLAHPDQVSFVAFESLDRKTSADSKHLHKQQAAWLAGGLFGGGRAAMETFYDLHRQVMTDYMNSGTIDDDQTSFVDCVLRDRKNFRPVLGSWYDLMQPFT